MQGDDGGGGAFSENSQVAYNLVDAVAEDVLPSKTVTPQVPAIQMTIDDAPVYMELIMKTELGPSRLSRVVSLRARLSRVVGLRARLSRVVSLRARDRAAETFDSP